MIHDKLKKIIFDKLYKDLSHVEIIPFKNSIWFIDREERYWYFEYEKPDVLWWRWGYFTDFFTLFSLESEEFQWVLSEWVEEVLNCKVNTSNRIKWMYCDEVEEVLNCKVNTPQVYPMPNIHQVEEVLNCKVNTTSSFLGSTPNMVEEVLNYKVKTPLKTIADNSYFVEQALNYKVNKISHAVTNLWNQVGEVLNENK